MDKELLGRLLRESFSPEQILEDEPMSLHTTFEVGGPVNFMVFPSEPMEIRVAIEAAEMSGAPWRVLGCGSNVLVADRGLEGLVIAIGARMSDISISGNSIDVQAGATNKDVAEAACTAGLAGYEFASGIPGSIGGAAIMNAGAYDGEFKNVCTGVVCLNRDGSISKVPAAEADWSYRHSSMSDNGQIVLSAHLELSPDDRIAIRARMDDLKARREAKQPLDMASAGSTFKRPRGYFAGKLIQDAGMRGHRVGKAMVSEKHCGFVVNTGGATAEDVLSVIRDVQKAVKESSGVDLQPEVRLWGFEE
ncbi:MAG: UDP-N-acetylmuramate dehydrogenase [Coriobacteriales bacterium]|jgi:UDP-N-acetylmuramate dehydrogenase